MKRRGKQQPNQTRTNVQDLASKACDKLAALMSLAGKGDHEAALELYRATNLGIGFLHMTFIKNPDLIRRIAGDQKSWPVLFNGHRDDIEDNTEFVREIGLGSQTGSSFMDRRAPSSVWNPAIGVVEQLHNMANVLIDVPRQKWTYRQWLPFGPVTRFSAEQVNWKALEAWGRTGAGSRLPKLSKSTASLWARATVKLFDLVYGHKFDEHPDLSGLRCHHQNAKDTASGKNSVSAIRRAMRKAVKQAWRGYAGRDN